MTLELAKPGHRAERRRSTAGDRRPDARQLPQPVACAASSRIYIEAPIYDQLVAGFEQAGEIAVGRAGHGHRRKSTRWCRSRTATRWRPTRRRPGENAELIGGAAGPDANGFYIPPTLVINPDDRLNLTREEVFARWLT